MRILINALWRATTPSGICRHAAALARCLCLRNDIECVFLLAGSWQEQYLRNSLQISHDKLVVRSIGIANNTCARNFWYLYDLPRLAEEAGADIVHLTFPVPLSRQLRLPAVTTLHDLYPYDIPANFGYPHVFGHRMILRQCLERSERIACVSDFTRGRLHALFGPKLACKATRIYNCVEASAIHEHRPGLLNYTDRPFLLCVAQHRKNKNIDLLLKGFALMRAEGVVSEDTSLLIVGSSGPETRTIVRTIAKLALCEHVILAQGMTDAELAWLYKHALLALCTSTIEGFGLPLVEARQYGTHVVCSDIPAFREIGEDDCTFFPLHSANPVESFARACEYALHNPGRTAHQNPSFTANTIAAQYMNLYSDLLQAKFAAAA